jgi:catechol 2,3-dioxygenase-like lactoylglutathione lyase family enzyme
MIHHVSVGTNDVDRARAFYDPLMALLGYRNVRDYPIRWTMALPMWCSASRRR